MFNSFIFYSIIRNVIRRSLSNQLIEPQIDYKELGTEGNLNHFCGIFLQSFNETIICKVNISDFIADKFVDDDKEMQEKLEAQIGVWKSKFNKFIEHFWNHSSILNLFHSLFPLETCVEDKDDGFEFIIQTLTDAIQEKIFYGVNLIQDITFICSYDNSQYEEDVLLFDPEGLY